MKAILKSTGQEIQGIASMVENGGRQPTYRGYMRFLVPNNNGKTSIQVIHKSKVKVIG